MTRKELAERVARSMAEESDVPQAVAFDPAMLAIIAAIIQALLPMLTDCLNPRAVATVRNPSWFQRWTLSRIVHRVVWADRSVKNKDFRRVKGEVTAALLKTGKRLSAPEVVAMLEG